MPQQRGQQQQTQKKVEKRNKLIAWANSPALTDEERKFLWGLSEKTLEILMNIEDDSEKKRIFDGVKNEQKSPSALSDEALLTWYVGLEAKYQEVVNKLGKEKSKHLLILNEKAQRKLLDSEVEKLQKEREASEKVRQAAEKRHQAFLDKLGSAKAKAGEVWTKAKEVRDDAGNWYKDQANALAMKRDAQTQHRALRGESHPLTKVTRWVLALAVGLPLVFMILDWVIH